jgi:hypothetical protein
MSDDVRLARRRKNDRERYATDPTFRQHRLELSRAQKATPEYRTKAREYSARKWRTDSAYRKRHREAVRRYKRRKKYGITEAEYRELKRASKGRCAICNRKARLVIDHDHITGKVRGLLCDKCNGGLGCLDDNIAGLRRAIKYLKAT